VCCPPQLSLVVVIVVVVGATVAVASGKWKVGSSSSCDGGIAKMGQMRPDNPGLSSQYA